MCMIICLLFASFSAATDNSPMKTDSFYTGKDVLIPWVEAVENARETIYIAVYKLSSTKALNALLEAAGRGVEVKLITDEAAADKKSSLAGKAAAGGVEVTLWPTEVLGKLHAKFYIFDGKSAFIGSFNLTESAEKSNTESFIFTHDKALVPDMLRSWEMLKEEAELAG